MKVFKAHKIKNVPLDVCTAEQKIAYNIADEIESDIQRNIDRFNYCMRFEQENFISDRIRYYINYFGETYKTCRVNLDLVFVVLMNGFRKYHDTKYKIATSYREVGEMLPIPEGYGIE